MLCAWTLAPAQAQSQVSWARRTFEAPPERREHAMTYDSQRSKVVMFGGDSTTGLRNDTWEWSSIGWNNPPVPGPPARMRHAMAYDELNNTSVLFGGLYNGGNLGDTWLWDGNSWTQQNVSGPSARYAHAMVYDSLRNKIVLYGGLSDAKVGRALTSRSTWEWDGSSWSLASTAGPAARYGHAMAYDSTRNKTVLFGGYADGLGYASDTWEWDGSTWTQVATAGLTGRYYHAMSFDRQRGKVVMFGGYNNTTGNLDECWEWDGALWAPAPHNGPGGRFGHAMAYHDQTNETLLTGGRTVTQNYTEDTWASDGTGWNQLSTTGPSSRILLSMTFDKQRSRTVIFGGTEGGNVMPRDVWEWDGVSWTRPGNGGTGPLGRYGISSSFDTQRNKVVVFGGLGLTVSGIGMTDECWEWDGSQWLQRILATRPPARRYHSMVYDRQRAVIVMFGGYATGIGFAGDTWEFNGANWQLRSSIGPAGRYLHTMAYDEALQKTFLFGGKSLGVTNGDTWAWDGNSWTPVSTTGPSARSAHGMTYDSIRNKTILFGGNTIGTATLNDTWEWDGSNWTALNISGNLPSARRNHSLSFDSMRGRVVLFGGGTEGETWELVVPSSASTFGNGCGSPPLTLSPVLASPPSLGTTARAALSNMPSIQAFVAVGASRTSYGSLTLPLSLGPYNMPGCQLLQSMTWWQTLVPGSSFYNLPLPSSPELLDLHLYVQAWALAPGANPANVIVSNGLEWLIGTS